MGVTANEEDEPVIKPRGSRVRVTTTTTPPPPSAVVEEYEDEEDVDISSAPRRGQPSRRPSVGSRTAAGEEDDEEGERRATRVWQGCEKYEHPANVNVTLTFKTPKVFITCSFI